MENPKVIKKGDQVITSYVDEKTGKISVYEVGIKLEVSDFSGQWFPAKIVEVDKGEKEVLVHFENWSTRFDEWIKMDSNRLRPSPNTNIVKTQFKVGEEVEALWNTDGQRYSGVIQSILPNDYYQVLFDDGIKLKKKYNQIFKLKPVTRNISRSSGSSNPKLKLEVIPTPPLPELTPIPQLVSAAEQSQTQGTKVHSLQPPPLHPKPGVKRDMDIISKVSTSPLSPSLPQGEGSNNKRLTPTSPTSPPLEVALPPPEISPTIASPIGSASAEEPLSSKRKRTVQDYSALLKIRRRFSYHKDTGERLPKGSTRRTRHAEPEPPELFPETLLPLLTELPGPSEEDSTAETVSADPLIEAQISPEEGTPRKTLHFTIPPLPPKAKLRRKFKSRRRAIKRQPIKYVVVDDEEFKAASDAAKLNSLANLGLPSSTPLDDGTEDEQKVQSMPGNLSAAIPEESSTNENAYSHVPIKGVLEPRIIKRRRRRTRQTFQQAQTSASIETPNSSNEEPLSKRKRTIHDYSMLLKTRPKFFFDIDEEQKRPNVLCVAKSIRRRKPDGDVALDISLASLPSSSPSTSPSQPSETIRIPTPVIISEYNKTFDTVVLPLPEIPMKSETVVNDTAPTSIATHRPIRRSSSQFARKAHVSPDDGDFRLKSESLLSRSTPGRRELLKTHPRSFNGDVKKDTELKTGSSELTPKPLERKLLGSKLNELDFDSTLDDNEELLDIDYYSSASAGDSSSINISTPVKIIQPAISTPSSSTLSSTSTKVLQSQRREPVKKRSRLTSNRWWKKRTPHGVRKLVSANENGELRSPPRGTPSPRSRKAIQQKIRRRPGDLMSGLTLKRIKTIRSNLYGRGFRKRIIAEPALKDVSVDIIRCVCGSTDEHGLMVQCEYCQCWQHGQCFEIETVNDMPKNYVCEACLYPDLVRSKMIADFPYDFHRIGKLPRFSFAPGAKARTTKLLQESNSLMDRLYQVREIIHTSRVYMSIMEAKPDHPKLYQWDKPHTTIRERNQERKFNTVYRPLLRRLLFFNRDNPTYVEKLRAKVEAVVNKRSCEERWREEQILNERLGISIPMSPLKVPIMQKNSGGFLSKSRTQISPPRPHLIITKDPRRQESEAIRIRKELESLIRPQVTVPPLDFYPKNTNKSISKRDTIPVVSIDQTTEDNVISVTDTKVAVAEVMESVLTKLESTSSLTPIRSSVIKSAFMQKVVLHLSEDERGKLYILDQSDPVVKLENEARPPFLAVTLQSPTLNSPSVIHTLRSTDDVVTRVERLDDTKDGVVVSFLEPPHEAKLEQELNAADLMILDPLDPKFTTIAEDLVKSCCAEPEGLIKTLENMANDTAGVMEDLEGNDTDLLNFIDDAFMDNFDSFSSLSSSPSLFVEPKPPQASTSSSSSFFLPPPMPITLTRITPELCRGNLLLTVLDQQRIIDLHIDEIEARVAQLEKSREAEVGSRASAIRAVSALQMKVQKMIKEFELIKSIGQKAEHGLRDLIRLDPSRLDGGSASEADEEGMENEETDSVEEEEDEEDFFEDYDED